MYTKYSVSWTRLYPTIGDLGALDLPREILDLCLELRLLGLEPRLARTLVRVVGERVGVLQRVATLAARIQAKLIIDHIYGINDLELNILG